MASSERTFNAVADALIKAGADDATTTTVLAALMDVIGVPALSFQRYLDRPAIEGLFNARGVRRATPAETGRAAE